MTIFLRIAVGAVALLLTAYIVPGIVVDGVYPAIIAAIVIGILSVVVRPILIILTLPVTILTLGLFIFVINAILFMFAASFIEGFSVNGFIPALLGSVLVSIITSTGHHFIKAVSK